jgi:hypothetical protein
MEILAEINLFGSLVRIISTHILGIRKLYMIIYDFTRVFLYIMCNKMYR